MIVWGMTAASSGFGSTGTRHAPGINCMPVAARRLHHSNVKKLASDYIFREKEVTRKERGGEERQGCNCKDVYKSNW